MNTFKQITKGDVIFAISLLLAIYFALTFYVWTYFMNLVISLPFGLLSLLFWGIGKRIDSNIKRYKIIVFVWACGVAFSLGFLLFYLVYD